MRVLTYLLLLLMAMVIAGVYGALHDQISYTVSSEYFTEFKYRQFGLLDVAWPDRVKAAWIGVLASWWMGIPIGILAGAFGFLHPTPRMMWVCSMRAFALVALVALGIGVGGLFYGWFFASHDLADYNGWFLPDALEEPRRYLSVGHMHNASYLGGAIGILFGVAAQFFQRRDRKEA